MALSITSVENHREREKGNIIYPVYSRRSRGLSVGVNLFTEKKSCPFDCPYCEVFPFPPAQGFSLEQMGEDLRQCLSAAIKQNTPVMDICFSGNGEPTLSPAFADALKLAENIRKEMTPQAKLVIITNGAGLLIPEIFTLLKDAARNPLLDIWLKLDAGTDEWYQMINRTSVSFKKIMDKIIDFTSCAQVTIQTMLCAINKNSPSETEAKAWEGFICGLPSGNIRKVQVYGKARPAPEDPLADTLPPDYLEKRAASLRAAFAEKGIKTPVEVYL